MVGMLPKTACLPLKTKLYMYIFVLFSTYIATIPLKMVDPFPPNAVAATTDSTATNVLHLLINSEVAYHRDLPWALPSLMLHVLRRPSLVANLLTLQ